MAGGMGGGGGGGGGGSGSALGTSQPLAQTAGTDFSGNAMSPGGAPSQFVDNAAMGGGSPAAVVGGPNDPVTQAQTQGLYASTVTPPSSPTGTQSGPQGGNWGSNLSSIITTLFGSQAQASTLPSVAGRAPTADSAGWPMAGGPAGAGGRDPFGNTYTTAPGYQGSPAHPLPPYSPPAAAATAPAAAPAPAPQPEPQPPAAETGGDGKITPAPPTPEKATEPEVPPLALNTAQSYLDPATSAGASSELTGQSPTAAGTARRVVDPTGLGQVDIVAPALKPGSAVAAETEPAPAPAPAPPADWSGNLTPAEAAAIAGAPAAGAVAAPSATPPATPPAQPAPVSPQSSTGPGNTPTGGWKADPDSAIGKLMRGDYSGAFSEAMRALTGQLGTPGDQNMIGKGVPPPPPTPVATEQLRSTPGLTTREAARIDQGRAFQPPIPVPGTSGITPGARDIGIGAGSGQPMDPFTAGAPPSGAPPLNQVAKSQDRVPQAPETRIIQPHTSENPGNVPIEVPAARGTAGAAAAPQTQAAPSAQRAPQTIQERTQWRAGYENWRSTNKLSDTPQNRERFNTEHGYPKGSSSAAPTAPAPAPAPARAPAPAPGQAGAATRQPGGVVPSNTARGTDMLNAILARQGLPPLPPGGRIGAPPPQFAPPAEGRASANPAANVGQNFPRGDWRQFMRNARPSTNVEDMRSGIPGMAMAREALVQGPEANWQVTPEQLARFNPNDPMTRSLMGSNRAAMRDDVLRSMTPDEFMNWLGQMREQGGQLLKERYQPTTTITVPRRPD